MMSGHFECLSNKRVDLLGGRHQLHHCSCRVVVDVLLKLLGGCHNIGKPVRREILFSDLSVLCPAPHKVVDARLGFKPAYFDGNGDVADALIKVDHELLVIGPVSKVVQLHVAHPALGELQSGRAIDGDTSHRETKAKHRVDQLS